MWPTCVHDFLASFHLINFHDNFILKMFMGSDESKLYPEYAKLNEFYSDYDYYTYLYLYNFMEIVFFIAVFIALIPFFYLITKLVFSEV